MSHLSTPSLLSTRRAQEGTENALPVLRQVAASSRPTTRGKGGRTRRWGVLVIHMFIETVWPLTADPREDGAVGEAGVLKIWHLVVMIYSSG